MANPPPLPPSDRPALLYAGTNGQVTALDAVTGANVWRTALPHRWSADLVCLLLRGDDLFVGSQGHVLCLDAFTGAIRWENTLPGLGYQPVILAMHGGPDSGPEAVLAAAVMAQQAAASAAAASG